eukprot:jgi/Mesen1/6875/ME000352S05930
MTDVEAMPPQLFDDRRRDRSAERKRERSPPGRRDRDKDDRGDRRRSDNHERRFDDRGDRRDKERDYKRRRSGSPGHRERRHSPRHSPRRHGYDETFDGRSRPSGFDPRPEWPRPGRSGFDIPPPAPYPGGGNFNAPPARRADGVLSFKHFMAELEEDVSPAEAERRYEAYKLDFMNAQKQAFFSQHKDEDWLRDKYDPARLDTFLQRRNENAINVAKDFFADLQAGTLDLAPSALKGGRDQDDADGGAKRRRTSGGGRGPHSRDPAEEAAPRVSSAAAEPPRVAEDIRTSRVLALKLDEEKGVTENPLTAGLKESEGADADAAAAAQKGAVAPPPVVVVVHGPHQTTLELEGLRLLDTLLTYLWRVHGLDYYGGAELKGLPRGVRHVRAEPPGKGGSKPQHQPEPTAADFEKWAARIDGAWRARLEPAGVDPLVAMLGREKVEKASGEALEAFVRKIKDEKYGWKYGCGAKGCTKLFHGPEFVYKHLKLKHPEVVTEAIAKLQEDIYFDNYLNDPNAPVPGVTPGFPLRPGQMPLPGDAGRKRPIMERLSSGGRRPSGFDNGGLRDGEHYERGGGRDFEADRFRGPPGEGDLFDRDPRAPFDRTLLPPPPPARGDLPPLPDRFPGDDLDRYDRPPLRDDDVVYKMRGMDDREPPLDDERFDLRGLPRDGGFPPPLLGGGAPPFEDRKGPPPPFDGPPLDAPIFDPFDGPPMRAPPPFGPGPPPPMLIPVPGAGPLGPFVPAPPEVAMRMLREQGGPPPPHFFDGMDGFEPPFEPSFDGFEEGMEGPPLGDRRGGRGPAGRGGRGGGRGREGSPPGGWGGGGGGPPRIGVLGPPPPPMFMPMPANMRADPRRVRSYRDLDAPEDEVTVIDYRSL